MNFYGMDGQDVYRVFSDNKKTIAALLLDEMKVGNNPLRRYDRMS